MFDPNDVELRERLAESAYLRERYEDMVIDREFELREDAQYFALAWNHLSGAAQRPYRIAVAVALEHVAELVRVG